MTKVTGGEGPQQKPPKTQEPQTGKLGPHSFTSEEKGAQIKIPPQDLYNPQAPFLHRVKQVKAQTGLLKTIIWIFCNAFNIKHPFIIKETTTSYSRESTLNDSDLPKRTPPEKISAQKQSPPKTSLELNRRAIFDLITKRVERQDENNEPLVKKVFGDVEDQLEKRANENNVDIPSLLGDIKTRKKNIEEAHMPDSCNREKEARLKRLENIETNILNQFLPEEAIPKASFKELYQNYQIYQDERILAELKSRQNAAFRELEDSARSLTQNRGVGEDRAEKSKKKEDLNEKVKNYVKITAYADGIKMKDWNPDHVILPKQIISNIEETLIILDIHAEVDSETIFLGPFN